MKVLKLLAMAGAIITMASCGNSTSKQQAAEEEAEATAFYEAQPAESGIYDATYFDIKGKDPRKGQFDGRVIYSLSPEQSAIFVYENGNRTKIKHVIMLKVPFEKGDSTFSATDAKGMPVEVSGDSINNYINFIANNDTVKITFNKVPRNTYTPLEALEKINEAAQK